MPGPEVIVKFNTKPFEKYFKKVKDRTKNSAEILKAAFSTFGFKDVIDHFKKEEGPRGSWPTRRPSTDDMYEAIRAGRRKPPPGTARASYGKSNKILQLTGNLRKSFLPSNVKRVNRQAVLFFTRVPYAATHEFGDSKKNIPERSFMWLSKKAHENMAKTVLRLIAGDKK